MSTPSTHHPDLSATRYIEVPCTSIHQMKREERRRRHRNGLSVFDSLNTNTTHKLKKYVSSINDEAEELPNIRGNGEDYKHYIEANHQLKKLRQFKETKYTLQTDKQGVVSCVLP